MKLAPGVPLGKSITHNLRLCVSLLGGKLCYFLLKINVKNIITIKKSSIVI